ncbi:MAG: hypothetical protein AAF687_11150 [Pseudomonadota bacterium]
MKRFVTPWILFAVFAAPAAAQDPEPVSSASASPGPEIEAVLDALNKGDREGALDRITSIEKYRNYDRTVRTPAAFVDWVIGCPASQVAVDATAFRQHYIYRWDCPTGAYEARLTKHYNDPFVWIIDPVDEAGMAVRKADAEAEAEALEKALALAEKRREAEASTGQTKRPMFQTIAAPPPPESPEERQARLDKLHAARSVILETLEPQIRAGRFNAKDSPFKSDITFVTGYIVGPKYTFITRHDAVGLDAGDAQLEWLRANLGETKSVDCQQDRTERANGYVAYLNLCKVTTEDAGHAYNALVVFDGEEISDIRINYSTPATRAKSLALKERAN